MSLVEAAVSIVIVGVMFVVAMRTLAASRTNQFTNAQRCRGLLLARDLMAEILRQPYEDPNQLPVFGHEPGEATNTRADCDDVDDYDGYSGSPPQYRDGTPIPSTDGYERTATVGWVDPSNLGTVLVTETGIKRIRVTVSSSCLHLATLWAIRTSALPDPSDMDEDTQ